MDPVKKTFTFADIFSGIGGFRLPFEQIGGTCVYSCEIDKFARQTYSANFDIQEPFDADLYDSDVIRKGKMFHEAPDIVLAGFPCQAFSRMGVSSSKVYNRKHGLESEVGRLFFCLADYIKITRPKAFLLENVKTLLDHNGGSTLLRILFELKELRYTISTAIINSDPWVPQTRERIFFAGFKDTMDVDFSFGDVSVPTELNPKLGDILEPLSADEAAKYTLSAQGWKSIQEHRERHRKISRGGGFGYRLFGPNDVCRTLQKRSCDSRQILISQEGNALPRILTPRECARLMGFPDAFKIPVSNHQAYYQFGNSVVVPLVRSIAISMHPHITRQRRRAPLFVIRAFDPSAKSAIRPIL